VEFFVAWNLFETSSNIVFQLFSMSRRKQKKQNAKSRSKFFWFCKFFLEFAERFEWRLSLVQRILSTGRDQDTSRSNSVCCITEVEVNWDRWRKTETFR
jgi:hypothetical protein